MRLPRLSGGAYIGLSLMLLFVLAALLGPSLWTVSPTAQDLDHLLMGPSLAALREGHPLGTEENGCDLLAALLHGARLAAGVSVTVVALCLVTGLCIGAVAGYSGGVVDDVIMRVIDILMALPGILLNIAIVALVKKPGVGVLIFALSINGWVGYARVARGQVLQLREREYVQAARSLGASPARVLFYHILPGILSPLIVQATFGFAGVILVEASLSFLGLGLAVPYSWGALLAQGNQFYWRAGHLLWVPGSAIALVVLGCNLLGDGLRDLYDPRRRQRS